MGLGHWSRPLGIQASCPHSKEGTSGPDMEPSQINARRASQSLAPVRTGPCAGGPLVGAGRVGHLLLADPMPWPARPRGAPGARLRLSSPEWGAHGHSHGLGRCRRPSHPQGVGSDGAGSGCTGSVDGPGFLSSLCRPQTLCLVTWRVWGGRGCGGRRRFPSELRAASRPPTVASVCGHWVLTGGSWRADRGQRWAGTVES